MCGATVCGATSILEERERRAATVSGVAAGSETIKMMESVCARTNWREDELTAYDLTDIDLCAGGPQ